MLREPWHRSLPARHRAHEQTMADGGAGRTPRAKSSQAMAGAIAESRLHPQ